MNYLSNWVMGALTCIMAVAGLFVAANAASGVAYYGGLGFFVFALGFVFLLIKVSYDQNGH